MKSCDVMETFVYAVENTIFNEWRHEGFIGGWTSNSANFVIDGKEYVLKLGVVHDGEHWSEVENRLCGELKDGDKDG